MVSFAQAPSGQGPFRVILDRGSQRRTSTHFRFASKADVNSPFPHVAKGQQRLYTLLTP
jgi:hypothetical protein